MAQLLQQQWSAVGIDVKVNLVEQAKLIIQVVSGSYQATSWLQFDAPIPYVDGVWIDPDGAPAPPAFALNFARNKDEEIGKALDASAADPTVEGQRKQWAIIQQRLGEDIPYIWLTHTRISVIASKRVVNLTHYELPGGGGTGLDLQQGAHSVKQIWLKP
jgi:ABC-type transport system substrate-binding protein